MSTTLAPSRSYLTRYDLMLRWHYDPENKIHKRRFADLLARLGHGRHPSGARLHPIPINGDLFDPEEVAAVEKELKEWRKTRA